MESLKDWHRYVDSVSRPVRQAGEEPPAADDTSWRPWNAPADEAPPSAVRAEDMPDLAVALGAQSLGEARHPASVAYEDPTVNDELRPIKEFTAPALEASVFELAIPTFTPRTPPAGTAAAAAEDESEWGDAEELEPEDEPRVLATAQLEDDPTAPPPSGEELLRSPRAARHLEMLAQLRSEEPGAAGQKARLRESRGELLQRLLDPLITLEETARILGVCPTTVRRYTNKGQLKHLRTQGNQRRFRFSDVLEFMEARSSEIEADAQAERAAGLQ